MSSPHVVSMAVLASALLLVAPASANASYFDSTYSQGQPAAAPTPAPAAPVIKTGAMKPKTTDGYVRIPEEKIEIRDPWLVRSPMTSPSIVAISGQQPSLWTYVKYWVKGRAEIPSLNPADRPDYPRTTAVVKHDFKKY